MKAAYLVGPKQIELKDVNPRVVKPGYIETKVEYCAICGSDLHMWERGEPQVAMGHEFSATVTNPGDSAFKVGDRVVFYCGAPCYQCDMCAEGKQHLCRTLWSKDYSGINIDGGLAEKYVGLSRYAYKLPEGVSLKAGALVEPTAVAYHAVNQSAVRLGSKVLVVGGGIIGQLTGAMARRAGPSYVALSEVNPQRLQSAQKIGDFDAYFDADDPGQVAKLIAASGGGFDVTFECTAMQGGYLTSFLATKPDRQIVFVGAPSAFVEVMPILVVVNELHVVGAITYTFREYGEVIQMISNGFDPVKYVTDVVELADTQNVFSRLTSGTDPAIEILVRP